MAGFVWGNGGKITTPQEAARQRAIAEALLPKQVADNPWEGLSQLAGGFTAGQLNNRAAEAEAAGQASAAEALAKLGPQATQSDIIAALSNPWTSQPQASVASALLSQQMERSDPAYQLDMQYKQAQIDKLAAEAAGGGEAPTFFGTPIWGTGPDGQPAFGQLNNQGQFQVTDTGDFQAGKEPIRLDGGTEWILLDPVTRQPVGSIPKNNEEAAYETAVGTATGKTDAENTALYNSISSKMPGLHSVIDNLTSLADTATYTQSGQAMDAVKRELGLDVGQGAIDRSTYMAIVDNQVLPLLKDTFGAAFTVSEGESLRATLGNPNASPAEKKAILDSFIAQKERDVAAMQSNLPGGVATPSANPGPQVSPNGVEYSF